MAPSWANPKGEPYTERELSRSVVALEVRAYDSQKDLADSLGVSPRTVQRYKSREIDPNNSGVRQKIIRRLRYYGLGRFETERPKIKRYRHTIILQDTYDPARKSDPTVPHEIDIWVYTRTRQGGRMKTLLNGLLDKTKEVVLQTFPFVDFKEAKVETNASRSFTPPGPNTKSFNGRVEVKDNVYKLFFERSGSFYDPEGYEVIAGWLE